MTRLTSRSEARHYSPWPQISQSLALGHMDVARRLSLSGWSRRSRLRSTDAYLANRHAGSYGPEIRRFCLQSMASGRRLHPEGLWRSAGAALQRPGVAASAEDILRLRCGVSEALCPDAGPAPGEEPRRRK